MCGSGFTAGNSVSRLERGTCLSLTQTVPAWHFQGSPVWADDDFHGKMSPEGWLRLGTLHGKRSGMKIAFWWCVSRFLPSWASRWGERDCKVDSQGVKGDHFLASSALWPPAHVVLDKKIREVLKEGREALMKPCILLTKEKRYFFRKNKILLLCSTFEKRWCILKLVFSYLHENVLWTYALCFTQLLTFWYKKNVSQALSLLI